MKKWIIIPFVFSFLFALTNIIFYIFLPKESLGQGAYCQPLPYLNWGETTWPGGGYLVMTSSTQNVLVSYPGNLGIGGSGSAGQVAFWTGASAISGNNALFWDNTNKRLGIGTTTPQTPLHVAGNVTADTFLGTINAANVSSGQFGANTGGGDYYFMGNVGIGTTTPGSKLHVHGSGFPVFISSSAGAGGTPGIEMQDPTATNYGARVYFDDAAAGGIGGLKLVGLSNGVETLGIFINRDSGNVGIGTTNPESKLHIVGLTTIDTVWAPRIVFKGGVMVDMYSTYDPNYLLGWSNIINRVVKPTIDFTNLNPGGKADGWEIRVRGCIYVPVSGTYTFYLTTDDGARFWVNWALLIDQWKDQGSTTYSANYTFSQPGWYYIRIDHYENGGSERLLLEWSGPGINRQIVPSSNLGVCYPDLF